MCKTLLVGGLSVKILVMAAFYWESMKISGEGYLDLLNQSRRTPEAPREKKFCLQKGDSNDSECFDLPRSTIVKNTFLEKKL